MSEAEKPRNRGVFPLLLLLAALLLPYLFTLNQPFIYDDYGQIVENRFLENRANLVRLLALDTLNEDKIVNGRRPVVLLSYFVDRGIWKDLPGGYRLTNLAWHGLVLLAFGLLVFRLTNQRALAIGATALFGFHPALIEAVHIPAFRSDLFYSFGVLLFLLFGLGLKKAESRNRKLGLIAGMVAAQAFAIGSKEAGLLAPFLLAGLWWCFPDWRLCKKRTLAALAAGFTPILVFGLLCIGSETLQAATGEWTGYSYQPPKNLLSLPWLWTHYLLLFIFPMPLSIDRIVPPVETILSWRLWLGTAILLLTVWSMVALRRKHPARIFGLLLMVIVFLPVSNLVPLFNPVAERYAYFMAAGWGLVLASFMFNPAERFRENRVGMIALAVILLGWLTISTIRLHDFRGPRALWERTIQTHPDSTRAHTWLGIWHQEQGDFDQALAYFNQASTMNPRDVSALINMGIIFGKQGDLKAAEEAFRKAIERKPKNADAHWNLAVTLMQLQDLEGCKVAVADTLKHDPNKLEALQASFDFAMQVRDVEKALGFANRILAITPEDQNILSARKFLESRVRP